VENKTMNLSDICQITQIKVVKDNKFESLGGVHHRTANMLVFIESEKFLPALFENTLVSCVITNQNLLAKIPENYGIAISENPRKTFYHLHNYLANNTDFYWEDFPSEISPEAKIHPRAFIAEKNVRIGRETVIEANATVLERVIIGEDVILRSGCTIGSQGFEFKRIEGKILNVAHAGGVRLGDRVEVQANSAISRSIFGGFTELGEDTKLDNLVHVAHNVKIGKRCFLAACAMLAGSVSVGDDVWIGPGCSISSEITIGNSASITIGSVVTKSVEPGQHVSGNFAIDHQKFLSFIKSIR
jgi:UDP-3-O-[3-hydroxymyristoyl] glucosamine N-acyltransferase